MPIRPDRVDLMIQYALAVANEADDYRDRELGPIHLLKYIYLGDLAFARENQGTTFSGSPWKFHKFGPWAQELHAHIQSAATRIGAQERHFASQYQEELPVPQLIVRHFRVHVGQCRTCGRRVQGRHRLQTPDALGAAAAQLGPEAIAVAVVLNKQLGLSFGKVATLFRQQYGLTVTRSGLVHAVHRAARQAQPTYDTLCDAVRGSPVVTPDETGWKVAGSSSTASWFV